MNLARPVSPPSRLRIKASRTATLCAIPEMCFELAFIQGAILDPFYYRNDYVGIEQWSRFLRDGQYRCHMQLQAQHVRFAKLWNRDLQQQGFAEAFARHRQPHA